MKYLTNFQKHYQNIDTLLYKGIKNYFKTLDKNMDIKNFFISKIEKPLIESTLTFI